MAEKIFRNVSPQNVSRTKLEGWKIVTNENEKLEKELYEMVLMEKEK